MELQIIDIGRAKIDKAIAGGDHQTALATAQRLFPQRRRLLEGAMSTGDLPVFRELCGIPEGCEWVDGEYLPGPIHNQQRAIIQQPEPYRFDTAQAVELSKPVLWIGALCLFVAAIFTACKAILTGLSVAFVVIGEVLGYVAGGLGLLYVLRAMFTRGSDTIPAAPTAKPGGIYVTNNFNIVGNDGTNSIQ